MTEPRDDNSTNLTDSDLDAVVGGGATLGDGVNPKTQTILENKSKQLAAASNVIKKASSASAGIISNIK